MKHNIGDIIPILNLPEDSIVNLDESWILISDSQEVESLRESIPSFTCQGETVENDYDAFLVQIGEGDYTQVWGFYGIIPYLTKPCTLIYKGV